MITYPIYLENGLMVAFEIDSVYITMNQFKNLLLKETTACDICRKDRITRKKYDCHLFFKYKEKEFGVIEPFGDNSRYWIGPLEGIENSNIDVKELESCLSTFKPPGIQTTMAKLVTLDFITDIFRLIKSLLFKKRK